MADFSLRRSKQSGFSMLEILVTLVIIATALLGTAGLQLYAMRMGKSGEFRTQAVLLASDIAERMEANRAGAIAGNYAVLATSAPSAASVDCAANPCGPADLAAWDISQWERAVTGMLPQATWWITHTVTGDPSTYEIVINWVDRGSDKNASAESFRYTSQRTVSGRT